MKVLAETAGAGEASPGRPNPTSQARSQQRESGNCTGSAHAGLALATPRVRALCQVTGGTLRGLEQSDLRLLWFF